MRLLTDTEERDRIVQISHKTEDRSFDMWDRISEAWCKSMHTKAMWPMHGKYICPDCFREFPVGWAEVRTGSETAPPPNEGFVWAKPLIGRLKRSDSM